MDLQSLAAKYERKEFLVGDPSWFMHQVEGESNQELLAFIAAALSYGSRKQFLPKIQYILDSVISSPAPSPSFDDSPSSPDGSPSSLYGPSSLDDSPSSLFGSVLVSSADKLLHDWLTSGRYNFAIPSSDDCFYRLYTNRTFNDFLRALSEILIEWGSLKSFVRKGLKGSKETLDAVKLITSEFAKRGSVGVIPKNTQSSCKRVCMFLRWMVRDNSPVDLGLWSDIIDKRTLIIPMDTHVMQEACRMGLISSRTASMSTALKLSSRLREIFPEDPLKGDFALFGLGVDENKV